MGGYRIRNEYINQLDYKLYNAIPKAVLGAIAISSLTEGGDFLEEAQDRLIREWGILYVNGIVPQRPPKRSLKKNGLVPIDP